jgi:uncharacterized protein involved in tolerance to divalent cations
MKIEKYIVLGEKRNGRFYKAEEISIERFKIFMEACTTQYKELEPTFWEKLTGKHKKQKDEQLSVIVTEFNLIQRIKNQISNLIDYDLPKTRTLDKRGRL